MWELLFLLIILFLAVLLDYKTGKIPNLLIVAGMFAGIIQMIWTEDMSHIISSIPSVLFPILLLYPFFKIGGIGAGDIKLLSVTGFYLPFHRTLSCLFLAFSIGAILSLIKMTYHKNFKERMFYLITYLRNFLLSGQFSYYHQLFHNQIAASQDINHQNMEDKKIKEKNTEGKLLDKKTKIHMAGPVLIGFLLSGGVFP